MKEKRIKENKSKIRRKKMRNTHEGIGRSSGNNGNTGTFIIEEKS